MRILISGASGLTGTALTAALRAKGHAVSHLVRPGGSPAPGDVGWDPVAGTVDITAMEGADAVVHLSGASISGGRWTSRRKTLLRTSRVDSTRVLIDAMAHLRRKPQAFVCASAIGIYGNRGDEVLTESSVPGTDFLALLARDWEAEAMRAGSLGMSVVLLRFGIVLSAAGGALPIILLPFKFGVGGRLGSGTQWMSWIALDDAVEIMRLAITDETMKGPVNVVAPNPVTNAEFTRVAAATLHRPAIFPAPAFALRLALGEMADALLLASQRVIPEQLLARGHVFRFTELGAALRAILRKA